MKKIALVGALLGCIQLQSSYAMGNGNPLPFILRTPGNAPYVKMPLDFFRKKAMDRLKAVPCETAKVVVKATVEEAGKEATKKAASGLWGCVGGMVENAAVDLLWKGGTAIFKCWQNSKLNEAKDNFYSALENNKSNELNILTGFPKGCEKEVEALLKLSGGQEFLEYHLKRIHDAYNK